jgi:hypothetical protein
MSSHAPEIIVSTTTNSNPHKLTRVNALRKSNSGNVEKSCRKEFQIDLTTNVLTVIPNRKTEISCSRSMAKSESVTNELPMTDDKTN